jgi:fatty-acyl-CoA synthase
MQRSSYVTDWLEKRARLTPDRVGLIDMATGQEITYAEWNASANRTASLLCSLGVERGDRVSVYAHNCVEYLDLLFACGKIGAILHNINWRLTVREISQIIAGAAPRVLCYSSAWRDAVGALRPALSSAAHIVAMDGPAAPGERALAEREAFSAHAGALPGLPPDLSMDDPWSIYYTGGTTGLPKGAVLTHGNMTWNSVNTVTSWGISAGHAAPLQLPLFHVGGPNIFMLPLVHVGGTTLLCREFDLDQTFDLIAGGRITHFVGVPTMYIMMQQHARWHEADFSRLELVISGGAPCPLPVMEKFWAKGVDFKMGYGLTEAAGNNFWLPARDVRRKPGSVGFPIFHVDMKIVDERGDECAAAQPGELLIRGPHVMAGYWQAHEATAEVIKDGWLHTGDLARRDEDGYFTIIGRSKDMFISGGENVYPAEIESVMHAHPAVAEAALIGVPHETWGEVGRAFVVVERGHTLDQGELIAFLAERLARYKLPREVVFVDALPRTAVGKIDKKTLAARAAEPQGGP